MNEEKDQNGTMEPWLFKWFEKYEEMQAICLPEHTVVNVLL